MSVLGFSHEALFHRGDDELLRQVVPFVSEGVSAFEPVLVLQPRRSNEAVRAALGRDADAVTFADINEVRHNPARIIPVWRWFVDAHAGTGRTLRGIGQPITAERLGAELVECHRHEALLNVAFLEDAPLRLLCPYDVDALDPAVIDEAHRTHPLVHGEQPSPSARYAPLDRVEPFADPFPEPDGATTDIAFAAAPLHDVRRLVASRAHEAGLGDARAADYVVAVNEVATNSVQHGGGDGVLRMWERDGVLVSEIRDAGLIAEPLVGRRWPTTDGESGRGLWMANQVCDLVQVHSSHAGTAVRLHMRLI